MSTPLRYRQPEICDHLAGQYVAGLVTPRVRIRIEQLAGVTPELSRAIARWSDAFVELQQPLNESLKNNQKLGVIDFDTVWHSVNNNVEAKSSEKNPVNLLKNVKSALTTWKLIASGSALASIFMVGFLLLSSPQVTSPVMINASYLATMQIHGSQKETTQFVISAYAKQETSPSRLAIQWVNGNVETEHSTLHLWAEDRESGELTYIGLQELSNHSVALSKPEWLAISNSRRLLMTKTKSVSNEDNIVFSGLCLSLAQWQS
ncbi:hypothetical protein ACVBE9_06995 [Eionea flava]